MLFRHLQKRTPIALNHPMNPKNTSKMLPVCISLCLFVCLFLVLYAMLPDGSVPICRDAQWVLLHELLVRGAGHLIQYYTISNN